MYIDFTVSNDAVHNQKPEPIEGISGLVLTRPFTVLLSNHGSHRDIPATAGGIFCLCEGQAGRFGFDTYLGTDRGTFLKGDTWHSLKDLGIDSRQDQITFYTPFGWMKEFMR